jgi:two-component system, NarL family, sensor histidine kinase BarA
MLLMMSDWGIRARVILLAIVPTGLVAIVMGSYFVATRVQDLNVNVQDRGLTVANYVAQTSEYSLLTGNKETLERLVNSARDGDVDILAIAIFSKNNLLLASSGTQEVVSSLARFSDEPLKRSLVNETENGLLIKTPIYSHTMHVQQPNILAQNKLPIIGTVAVMITNKNIQLRQYQTIVTALIILLVGLVLAGILAHNMARNITIPIIQLANAVKRIKEGLLKVKIKSNGTGELKTLVDGFNDMSESLYEAREEMQQAIEQATADINATNTALEEQNVELNIARKEAVEASRVKSEFLANMSHEIRTPMNGVIGFTNLLLKSEINEQQHDYLLTIQKSANGLLAIIDDILDFSKIEAGKMEIENINLSISDCVDETLKLLAPAAQSKNIEVVGIVYQDVPNNLKGDAGRICQILTNLCNNAIKFTKEGTIQIRVMLEEENNNTVKLRINITDTGLGLSEEQQKILFHAFTQADTTTTRRFGGTGLGLVISKKLAESMHGRIGIESKENVGSTFWFTVRLDKDLSSAAPMEYGFPGRRVLFHDANHTSQLATNYLLGRWEAVVENTNSLEELVERAEQYQRQQKDIHLIIVSGYSPNEHKIELLRLLKAAQSLNTPLATLVNSKEEKVLRKYAELGIHKLYSKPITRQSFYGTLSKWFNIKQDLTALAAPKQNFSPAPIKVLCVDDNEANLKLADAFLGDFELERVITESGVDAIKKCKATSFDIIFMDMQMPEMDGLETTKAIRRINQHYKKVPIIALTAHAMKGEKEKVLNEGMTEYLTKPIGQTQLQNSIEQWTSRSVTYKVKPTKVSANSEQTQSSKNLSIDWQLSLKNAGGREELALDMLDMLVKSFVTAKEDIKAHFDNDNLAELIAEVHKLHGATAYCGVPQLKYLANKYESLLKQDGVSEEAKIVHHSFLDEIENIETDAKLILNQNR